MIVTILQPAYFPYPGYFNMISWSDVFVFYDDVQITRWFTNRNRIRFVNSAQWMSIPIDNHRALIKDVNIVSKDWKQIHKKQLQHAYGKSELVESICDSEKIADVAIQSVLITCEYLGIKCKFYKSSELNIHHPNRTQRLVEICKYFGATKYITGMKSVNYIDKGKFENIELIWHDYKQPIYKQQSFVDFIPQLSILDLIANCGRNDVFWRQDINL